MADMSKLKDNDVIYHLRHVLRDFPAGKAPKNPDYDATLSEKNTYFMRRGNAAETNAYRKKLEQEIFTYKRKNYVHAVSVCVQCPTDCPEAERDRFFQESYNFLVSQLPMGERCVLSAAVHRDERKYTNDGVLISKDHMHFVYVPVAKSTKHEGYSWKLCGKEFTDLKAMKRFHPAFQKYLTEKGVHATVYRKKEGDGRSIPLTIDELKTLTDTTGIVLDRALTVDKLMELVKENEVLKERLASAIERVTDKEKEVKSAELPSWGSSAGWGTQSAEWGVQKGEKIWDLTN